MNEIISEQKKLKFAPFDRAVVNNVTVILYEISCGDNIAYGAELSMGINKLGKKTECPIIVDTLISGEDMDKVAHSALVIARHFSENINEFVFVLNEDGDIVHELSADNILETAIDDCSDCNCPQCS